MKSDLVIRIPAGSAEAHVSLTDDKGIERHKTVVVDNLISNLTSSFRFSTGLLPKNTRFFSGTTTDYRIGIESPPRVRRFLRSSYNTEVNGNLPKELKIPFPSCLFVFEVRGSKIRRSQVFGMSGGTVVRETDTACRFPFGNTYGDGRVCWGRNSLPVINNAVALTGVVATFFDAPFNGDLFDGNTVRKPHDMKTNLDFWSMLKYLNGKEVFPQEMLYDLKLQVSRLMRDPNV